MADFDELIGEHRGALERFVRYRVRSRADADDVIQEALLAAYRGFGALRSADSFKPWLMSIARNKVNDYFRAQARALDVPLDALDESALVAGRCGHEYASAVSDALERLGGQDKQILYLYFFRDLPQRDIARRLGIPLGTVKSRLHTAKRNFRRAYPRAATVKRGATTMKKLPDTLPAYTITPSTLAPFEVVWEELMGWFLVPREGEALSWGMYDLPSRALDHVYDMRVTGRAEVHGIEGVELTARESDYSAKPEVIERTFVAQLTDTHCRYLAAMRTERGVRRYITFLDGDAFMTPWGFGEDNCGNETHLCAHGDIVMEGDVLTSVRKPYLLDIAGRYTVSICGREFDTVCLVNMEDFNPGVLSIQYLDREGRTILWRRFNRDDWALERYGRLWHEQLPDNARITVNGVTYVEWYDCITDRVL